MCWICCSLFPKWSKVFIYFIFHFIYFDLVASFYFVKWSRYFSAFVPVLTSLIFLLITEEGGCGGWGEGTVSKVSANRILMNSLNARGFMFYVFKTCTTHYWSSCMEVFLIFFVCFWIPKVFWQNIIIIYLAKYWYCRNLSTVRGIK